ncbi:MULTISPECIES: hypothetical protein [unclassified Streptomyces]|uniref:hypothetical protein n=1 Tax=unclassified Streptomyces TaxID=2593676 RepID=UPI002E30E4BC|nr:MULTISPECIES: hypothetical protein [unclassified Streptomyces]WUC67787.1 DUF4097 domain-containing protein [Streptomyces sp. NBC_00539]
MTSADAPADAPGAPSAPARREHRRAWLLAALAGALLVLVPAGRQAWTHHSLHSRVLAGDSGGPPVRALEITGRSADITVTPRADGVVGYRAELGWSARPPVVEESRLGDTLRLAARCPGDGGDGGGPDGPGPGPGCDVRLAVTVPAGIPVRVSAGSGRVDISGMAGPVDASVDSGTLNLVGLRGAVRARAGSGALTATGLASARADIAADSGHALAAFLAPPEDVTARVGSGGLDLAFPPATRFRVDARAGSGTCEVAPALRDPASPYTLTVSAESGRAEARTTASY